MKIILRIVTILLVAAAVAGVFSLAVNNTAIAYGPDEGGQPPAVTDANGQAFQPMERREGGDHEGGSSAQGLAGIIATLLKLTGITILVLLLQKALDLSGRLKWKPTQG